MIGPARTPAQRAEEQVRLLFAGEDVLETAIGWARATLEAAGIDAHRRSGAAARALRAARPGLTRIGARYLVHRVAGGGPARGDGGGAALLRR